MSAKVPTATKPLAGTTIIELSTMVSVSMATMMLAAQGADVIKIETVKGGDLLRHVGTQKDGISSLFANCNRGKKSVAVDLKSAEGQRLVRELALSADVVVNNFRTGVMERLSLGSAELRERNPRLLFASVTGYGSEGPMANDPAYDQVVQALAGFVSVQTDSEQPKFVRNLIVDKSTAYTVAQGITSALLARATTGAGQHLEVSMLHAGLFFLFPDGMMNQTLLGDGVIETPPMADGFIAYATKDGFIAMAPSTDAHWEGFAKAVDKPEFVEDPRFNTQKARLVNSVDLYTQAYIALMELTTADAITRLRDNDIPCAPCLSPADVIQHEQVRAIGAVEEIEHPSLGPVMTVTPPVRFAGNVGELTLPCPALGEHSDEVAAAAGFTSEEIASLRANGTLGG